MFIRIGFILLAGFLLLGCAGGEDSDSASVSPQATKPTLPTAPTVPPTIPSLSYTSTTFNEKLANDGSIEGALRIEIADDTFSADVISHISLGTPPAGLTATLEYISNTTLILTFTGQATQHDITDSVTNYTIQFLDGAFVNTPTASTVTQYKNQSIGIQFIDAAPEYYLSYSKLEFTEAAANDGSISDPILITLVGDTFTADVESQVSVSNVPSGLTANFNRDSDTQVILTLNGTAVSHVDSADISNLNIAFSDAAFSNQPAASVIDSSKNLSVYYFDVALTYSGSVFTEAAANDGSIANTITITLTGDTFSDIASHASVTNVPAGLTPILTKDSNNTLVTLTFTGKADAHANSNDISNLTITFEDGAFTNASAANVTQSTKSDLSVNFDDTYGSLSYSGSEFTERDTNDGSIANSIDITLAGDTFTDAIFNSSHVTATNVPAGLTARFTRKSGTLVTLELIDNADFHADSNDISNLIIEFTDAAFTNALATNVTGSSKTGVAVNFIDVVLSYSGSEFTEAGANDGSIANTIAITLAGDTFTNVTFNSSHVTATNVPSGLTARFTRESGTLVTFKLDNNADFHANSNDISNLNIEFTDAAFVHAPAANVSDSLKTGVVVNFIDVSLSYSGSEFVETAYNDGSVSGSTEITLAGDTFAADFVDHVSATNVPGGLITHFTRNSDTLVTFDFAGHADAHANADDINDLVITFSNGAFAHAPAANVDGSSIAGLIIDFDDNPFLSYSAAEFVEDSSNDGSILGSMIIDLTGDTFNEYISNADIEVSNLPLGLAAEITKNLDNQLTFSLSGNADYHEISDSISNLTITFLDSAFTTSAYASAVVGYTKNDIKISFMDTTTLVYTYPNSNDQLNEADANDGSFTEILTIDLYGDTFSAAVVSSGLVEAFNVPLGLTADFKRDSDTQVTLSLFGQAEQHEKAHNIENLTIAFNDGAFVTKTRAADVTQSTKPDLKLNFYSSVISVSTQAHTCAVLAGGEVKCWGGTNSKGEHGRGDKLADIGKVAGTMGVNLDPALLGTPAAESVNVGVASTCALLETDQVKCWGFNAGGMLGLGDTEDRDDIGELGDILPFVNLGSDKSVTSLIVAGIDHCALLDTHEVKCWGYNIYGSLGIGNTTERIGDNPSDMGEYLLAIDFGDVDTVDTLAIGTGGGSHFCAILTNGDLKCWGNNSNGKLGLGDVLARGDNPDEMGINLPVVNLGTDRTAKSVAVSSNTTCAILDDDSLKCWGDNAYGQLGLGDYLDRGDTTADGDMVEDLDPVDLGTDASGDSHIHTAKAISTGNTTCAILDDDRVKCWGYNNYGQLGIGDISSPNDRVGNEPDEMGNNLSYIDLGTGRTAKDIVVGSGNVCAILDNNRLKCWGNNSSGQLGLEDTNNRGDESGEMGDNLPFVDL